MLASGYVYNKLKVQSDLYKIGARLKLYGRAFEHGVIGCRIDPLTYFSFQLVLHS